MSALKVQSGPAATAKQQFCVIAQMLQSADPEPVEPAVELPPLFELVPPVVDEPPVPPVGG